VPFLTDLVIQSVKEINVEPIMKPFRGVKKRKTNKKVGTKRKKEKEKKNKGKKKKVKNYFYFLIYFYFIYSFIYLFIYLLAVEEELTDPICVLWVFRLRMFDVELLICLFVYYLTLLYSFICFCFLIFNYCYFIYDW
jgi:hypothetical protein